MMTNKKYASGRISYFSYVPCLLNVHIISHIHFKADLDIVTDADLFNDFGKSHRATAIASVRA